MRTFLMIAVLLVVAFVSANADAPTVMNYQGLLTDAGGVAVADASYSVVFTIYDAAVAGTSVWTETQSVTTSGGIFSVLLGSVNPIEDTIFSAPARYLGIKVGADPEELTPRTMMVTVPYAFRVSTVDGASGGTIFDSGTVVNIITDSSGVQRGLFVNTYAEGKDSWFNDNNGIYSFIYAPETATESGVVRAVKTYAITQNELMSAVGILGDAQTLSTTNNSALGVFGRASGEGSGNRHTGVFGFAFDEGKRNVGVRGMAKDGDENWAGFFESNIGIFRKYKDDTLVVLDSTTATGGAITTWGPEDSRNVRISHMIDNPDYGAIGVLDDAGLPRVDLLIADSHPDSGHGYIRTFGPNGYINLGLWATHNNHDNGYISVFDDAGVEQVSIFVDHPDGDGLIYTDQIIVEARGTESGDLWAILPDDAINSDEILDEPGIASQQIASGATLVNTGMTDIETVTITIPAPGYIFVTGRTYVRTSGATTSNYINTQIDELTGGGSSNPYSTKCGMFTYPSVGFHYYTPTATRVYNKESSGTYTFILEGMTSSASHTTFGYNGTVTAMYFPTGYGSVATLAETPGDALNAEAVQVMVNEDPSVTKTMYKVDLRELELKAAKTRAAAVEAELELHKAQMRQGIKNSDEVKIENN